MPTLRDGVKETPALQKMLLIGMDEWIVDQLNKVPTSLNTQLQKALAATNSQQNAKELSLFFEAVIKEIDNKHSVIPLATKHVMAFGVTLFVNTEPFALNALANAADPRLVLWMKLRFLIELMRMDVGKNYIKKQAKSASQSPEMQHLLQQVVRVCGTIHINTKNSDVEVLLAKLEQALTKPEPSSHTHQRTTNFSNRHYEQEEKSPSMEPVVHNAPRVMPAKPLVKQTTLAAVDDAAHFSADIASIPSPMEQLMFNAAPPRLPPQAIQIPVTEAPVLSPMPLLPPNATQVPSAIIPTPLPSSLTLSPDIKGNWMTPASTEHSRGYTYDIPEGKYPERLPPLTIQIPVTEAPVLSPMPLLPPNATQVPSAYIPTPLPSSLTLSPDVKSNWMTPASTEHSGGYTYDIPEGKYPHSPFTFNQNGSPLPMSRIDRLKTDWLEHVLEQSAEAATHDFALDEESIAIDSESHPKALTLATRNKSHVIFKHSLEAATNGHVEVNVKGTLSLDQKIVKAAQMAMVTFFSDKTDAFFLGTVAPNFAVNAPPQASPANIRFAECLQQMIVSYITAKRVNLGVASADEIESNNALKSEPAAVFAAHIASHHQVPAAGINKGSGTFHGDNPTSTTSTMSETYFSPHPYHSSLSNSLD